MVTKTASGAASKRSLTLVLAWLAVGLPLLWGVAQTLKKTFALFQ